jgi:hypothetical protein
VNDLFLLTSKNIDGKVEKQLEYCGGQPTFAADIKSEGMVDRVVLSKECWGL